MDNDHQVEIIDFKQLNDGQIAVLAQCCNDPATNSWLTLAPVVASDDIKRRAFITLHCERVATLHDQALSDWDDDGEFATRIKRKPTTFDTHRQHLMVPYSDPTLLPKRKTTHDAAVERLTQEYRPVRIAASPERPDLPLEE